MKQYIESHSVSGIAVSGNSITFRMYRPAPWLIGAMTLPPFSAVPIEAENGLPAAARRFMTTVPTGRTRSRRTR